MGSCCVSTPDVKISKKRREQIQKLKLQINKKNQQIQSLSKLNTQLKHQRQLRPYSQEERETIKEEQVQIMSFQDKNDLDHDNDELQQLLTCKICQEDYNLKNKIPWMVCQNQHTYCSDCITRMINSGKNKCPECRQVINGGVKNLHLGLLLENINLGGTDQGGSKIKNTKPPIKMHITLNPMNPFLKNKSFNHIPPNTIQKVIGGQWNGLLFNEIFPATGKYFFTFEVIQSIFNNIQVGLIDVKSKIQQGKMSNKRITFHLYDGKQMDTNGSIDSSITSWRQGDGLAVQKGVAIVVQVQVNMDDNVIRWIVNGNLHAESVISNYIKYAKAVPYLSMFHKDDIVMLNV